MANSKFINIKSEHFLLLVLFLSLWLIAVSHFKLSRDFENYNNWCLSASESLEIAIERDSLFGISCIATSDITADPIALVAPLWIFASLLLKFIALRSANKIIIWSLLTYIAFFFVTQEVTQIRAALASAALGYAFVQLINKKYVKSVSLCFVAVAAHFSSLLFLPILLLLPVLTKTKLRFIITVVVCQIVFILSIFAPELQGLLVAILPKFVGTDVRIETYLNNYEVEDITALYKNARVGFFMIISIMIVVRVVISNQYDSARLIYGSTCMTSIAILILTLSYTVPTISLRSFELCAVPMSLMVGTYIRSIENKYYAYIVSSILMAILAGSFYKSLIILT